MPKRYARCAAPTTLPRALRAPRRDRARSGTGAQVERALRRQRGGAAEQGAQARQNWREAQVGQVWCCCCGSSELVSGDVESYFLVMDFVFYLIHLRE